MKLRNLSLILALLFFIAINAQDADSESNSSDTESEGGNENLGPVFDGAFAKISVGPSLYFGDLADYQMFPRPSEFSTHVSSSYKIYIGRDIKWGLGAQFHFQKGTLKGQRQPGDQARLVAFRNHYNDMGLSLRYHLSQALLKKNPYRRYYFNGFIGVGMVWWRTQLIDAETNYTKDYEGYVETESTVTSPNKGLLTKDKRPSILMVPYGVTFGYRLNYKADIFIDITQTSTFSDRLDAWSRDWTARDKYMYIGIGMTYNFNRDKTKDAIKKKPKPETKDEGEDEETSEATPAKQKRGLFGKKRQSKDDELLNIRLKLFETQLKLFEMQYLLENEQK